MYQSRNRVMHWAMVFISLLTCQIEVVAVPSFSSSNVPVKKYSTGRSQHNTDFAKTNQNEVVRIRTNFFEDFRICKLIREIKFIEENW